MRLQLRALMIAVAVAAGVLGLWIHIRSVIRAEDDFAAAILFIEGIAAAVLLAIGLAVGGFVRFLRKDDAYAARLRSNDVPARCPFPPAGPNSSE